MIKLAYGDSKVYVSLSEQEFQGLAGQSYSNIPDGTTISLVDIKQKLDLVDNKAAELTQVKQQMQQAVSTITSIGL